MQHHPADQLHVEVAHPQLALAGLAHDGEALGQERVQRLPLSGTFAEHVHAPAQLVVALELELRLEGVDQSDAFLVSLEPLALAEVQCAIQDGHRFKFSKRPPHLTRGAQTVHTQPSGGRREAPRGGPGDRDARALGVCLASAAALVAVALDLSR